MADQRVLYVSAGFATQVPTTDRLQASGLLSPGTLTIEPGSSSPLQADSAGDTRGNLATDWQRSRASTDQVASGTGSVVGGGVNNEASGTYDCICGGVGNSTTDSDRVVIVGGSSNVVVQGRRSFLGGGLGNVITSPSTNGSQYSVVVGGQSNIITTSVEAFIGGGNLNDIEGSDEAVICGGETHTILDSANAFIGGGNTHTIDTAAGSAILSGNTNSIADTVRGVIAGGQSNDIAGDSRYTAICGGINNNVTTSPRSAIGGGENHDITTSTHSTIAGGSNVNITSADYASAAGGRDNTISSGADYSFVVGRLNEVAGIYSTCSGLEGATTLRGEVAQSGGHFTEAGDAQAMTLVVRNQTTDATLTSLFLDGSSDAMNLPDNSCWTFRALVTGQRDTGAQVAGYELLGTLRRDGTGLASFVAAATKTVIGESVASWDASATVSGNALVLQVTGAAATNINWVARVDIVQVKVQS